jgi:hypothetical protein
MVDDRNRYTVKRIVGHGGTGETIYQTKDDRFWITAHPESMGFYENIGRGSGVEVRKLY